jgi:hypothetical protein
MKAIIEKTINLICSNSFRSENEKGYQKTLRINLLEHQDFNFFDIFISGKTVSSSHFASDNLIYRISEESNHIMLIISRLSISKQTLLAQDQNFRRQELITNVSRLRENELSLINDGLREICINIFDEKYMMKVNRQHNIGNTRKITSHWLDLDASLLNIKLKKLSLKMKKFI